MTSAAVLALAEAEGVSMVLNHDGDLVVDPEPSRDLDAGIAANVDALADLLRRRADWHAKVEEAFASPSQCARAADRDRAGRPQATTSRPMVQRSAFL